MTVRLWRAMLVLGLAVQGVVFAVHAGLIVSFPFEVDYGEGAVLQLATLLHRGEPLYRPVDAPPFVACLYTPVYVALSSALVGEAPAFWGGRLLSVLATLVVTALLVRRLGGWWGATFAALFLGHALVLNWGVLYRVDMLALLFAALGLLQAERPSRYQEVACAGWFALSILTKQSFLAAPVAVLVWWLPTSPWKALRLLAWLAGMVGLPLAGLHHFSQGASSLLLLRSNALHYMPEQLLLYLSNYLPTVGGMLVLAGLAARESWRERRLWVLYLAASLVSVLGSGRTYAFYNYFLEFHLALCVLA
ncbi:MAG: hypothetical protein AB1758_33095, partial [Candidatus Eremiobacterota bacterium]